MTDPLFCAVETSAGAARRGSALPSSTPCSCSAQAAGGWCGGSPRRRVRGGRDGSSVRGAATITDCLLGRLDKGRWKQSDGAGSRIDMVRIEEETFIGFVDISEIKSTI